MRTRSQSRSGLNLLCLMVRRELFLLDRVSHEGARRRNFGIVEISACETWVTTGLLVSAGARNFSRWLCPTMRYE